MTNVLVRKRQWEIGLRQKKRRHRKGEVQMKAEIGMGQPQMKKCLQSPETGRGKEGIAPGASKESETLSTLDFSLLASRTVRK